MHFSYFLLASIGLVQYTVADRGSAGNFTPTVCDIEPTDFPLSSVKSSSISTSTSTVQSSTSAVQSTSTSKVQSSTSAVQSTSTSKVQTSTSAVQSTSTSTVQSSTSAVQSTSTSIVQSSTSAVQSTSTSKVQTSKTSTLSTSTSKVQTSKTSTKTTSTSKVQTSKTSTQTTSTSKVQTSKTSAHKREESETYVPIAKRNRLDRRTGRVTYSNCNDPPPQQFIDKGFNTKAEVIAQAYKDAVAMAEAAQNVAPDNKGFTHYFGGEKPELQLQHFKSMMATIASNENHYSIRFECQQTPECTSTSAMVTDARVGDANNEKEIQVCEDFFTSKSTKWLLKDESSNDGPYRTNEMWCAKTKVGDDSNVSARKADWYATAGHTIIHELTHLDVLAAQVGLVPDPDDFNQHGTMDVNNGCELTGARKTLRDYVKDPRETSPDYNAESYAAAATEIYFMRRCGFSEIKPVVRTS